MTTLFNYAQPSHRICRWYKRCGHRVRIGKSLLVVSCVLAAINETLHAQQELPRTIAAVQPIHLLTLGGLVEVVHAIIQEIVEMFE